MAVFYITSSINIDNLLDKAGADRYNISGGYLYVDQDSRCGLNNHFSSSFGPITLSPTLGGTIEFNATRVRLIPFDGGSGTIPVSNTLISQSNGASGSLVTVYSSLTSLPLSASQNVPASGFIKIKNWNSASFVSGSILGNIAATASSQDVAGWIQIQGDDAVTATVNRLNTFKVRGDWYQLPTSSGVNSTTYQIPSNGQLVYQAGVWVETPISESYEFFPCAGTLTALTSSIATDEIRGKVCWISTAGLLRFQHDGTNSGGGYLPPQGRKIRIPNIFFSTNNTGSGKTSNNLPNTTLATRYDFITTGGGVIDIDKAMMNWYPSFAQPYSVNLSNVGICTQLLVSEIASPISWSQVGVGQEAANPQFGLSMATCFAGGLMEDCTWTSATLATSGRYVRSLTDLDGFTVNRDKSFSFALRGNATTGNSTYTRVANSDWTDSTFGGGRTLLTTCTNSIFSQSIYYDRPSLNASSSNPQFAFDMGTNCVNIMIDSMSFGGVPMVQPYSGILNIGSAGCSDIDLRNLGTKDNPLDLGGPETNATWTRVTTAATASLLSGSHNLRVGDLIYTKYSSDTGSISIAGSKVVTSTPTTSSFTFACTNTGAASGTLKYYATVSANLFVLTAAAASNNVKIKRCYTPHTRTNLYTSDNSSKNIILENVQGDAINAPLVAHLNGYTKGVYSIPPMTAQTSVYGSIWFDVFTSGVPSSSISQSWSRVTTLATASSDFHNLRTNDIINIISSSDSAAITLGPKVITTFSESRFTFPSLNAGAAAGTFSYIPLNGRIGILMNEKTSETSDNYTINSGSTDVFTSAGGLYMPLLSQSITFETPEYILGHSQFPIQDAVMAGGTITNYNIYYTIDKNNGEGSGSFRNLSLRKSGSTGTTGISTIVIPTNGGGTTGIEIGDYVSGSGIAFNNYVVGITGSNSCSLFYPNTGTVSGLVRFNHLPAESSITSSVGIKLKFKIDTAVTNSTAITSLYVPTYSSELDRTYQYPLDPVETSLELINLQTGTEVHVYRTSDNVQLAVVEATAGSTFTYDYTWTGTDVNVFITVHKVGYQWIRYDNQTLGSDGLTIPVFQAIDRNYLNN